MRPEYIFKIDAIYEKTLEDNVEIADDEAAKKKWKKAYKNFKDNIRIHLKKKQNGRCAFCRCFISTGTSYPNLEHLVSKTDYPQFITLPENLVYCCWKCNKSKLKQNTLSNPIIDKTKQTFPSTSSGFIIVNPYHDNYEDHIEFIDEVIIKKKGTSVKGENTIVFYGLPRPELAEDRAREFKLSKSTVTHQLMNRLTEPSTPPDVLPQIKAIISKLPDWTL